MPRAITREEFEKRNKFENIKIINYKNMSEEVTVLCSKHGEQKFTNARMFLYSKYGCKDCFFEKQKKDKTVSKQKKKHSNKELEEMAREVHHNKYDYIFPEYDIGISGKMTVICHKHGEFNICGTNHIRLKQGCRFCAMENLLNKITKSAEDFVQNCKEKFGERFDYDVSGYKNRRSIIKIKCKKCGYENFVMAKVHLAGCGVCQNCEVSNGEIKTSEFLQKNNILFEKHCTTLGCKYKNNLEFDFYLPKLNIVIEVQGQQHYIDNGWKKGNEFKRQQIRDQIKREFCKKKGIKELEIPYWEFDNIEKILKEKLN